MCSWILWEYKFSFISFVWTSLTDGFSMQHGNGMKAPVCVRRLREGWRMSGVGVMAHNTVTMSALFLVTSNQPNPNSLRRPADQSQQSDSIQSNKTAIELGSAAISALADDKFLQKGLPTPCSFAKQELQKLGPLVTLSTVKLDRLLIRHPEVWNTQIYVQRGAYAMNQTIPHRTKPDWLSETLITYLNDGDQLQVTARTIRFVLFCRQRDALCHSCPVSKCNTCTPGLTFIAAG